MKTPEAYPRVRPMRRIFAATAVLALSVGSLIAASSGWPPAKSKHAGRPLRPVCNITNCVEVKWPANAKSGPTFIRCELGKPCHPQCSRHCS